MEKRNKSVIVKGDNTAANEFLNRSYVQAAGFRPTCPERFVSTKVPIYNQVVPVAFSGVYPAMFTNFSGYFYVPPYMHLQRPIPYPCPVPEVQNCKHRQGLPQCIVDNAYSMLGGNAYLPASDIHNRRFLSTLSQRYLPRGDALIPSSARSDFNYIAPGKAISAPSAMVKSSELSANIRCIPHPKDYSLANYPRSPQGIVTQAPLSIQQQRHENCLHQQAQFLNHATKKSVMVTPSILPPKHNMNEVMNQRKKKKLKKRDPLRPKRPLSAYNLFFREERKKILKVKSSSGRSIPNKAREKSSSFVGMGSSNGVVTPSMEVVNSTNVHLSVTKGQNDNMVTTVATASLHDTQPCGKIGFEALGRIIGERWNLLNAEKRQKYNELAQEEMIRYKNEMSLYCANKEKESSNDKFKD